jgi:hypothetical protein
MSVSRNFSGMATQALQREEAKLFVVPLCAMHPDDPEILRELAPFVELGQGRQQITGRQIPRAPEDYQVPYHERTSSTVLDRAQVSWVLSLVAPPTMLERLWDILHLKAAIIGGAPRGSLAHLRRQRDGSGARRPYPRGDSHR